MATPTIYKTTTTAPSLTGPRGMAIDVDLERLLICDGAGNQLVRCYLDGIKQVDTTDSYNSNSFDSPSGCYYYEKNYYVCDTTNHVLVRFRARDLAYKDIFGTYGTSGSTTTKLKSPRDVCTDGEYLYVADTSNSRIMKLTLETMGYDSNSSDINGSFSPVGICVYRAGLENYLLIADITNNRIIKCKTDFTYIEQNDTNVTSPVHLDVINGFVHICNGGAGADDIVVLNENGLALATSFEDTTVTLDTPMGIIGYKDSVYIADTVNNRITVWRAYNPRDSLTPASKAKFGGKFSDQPMIVVGVDTVTAGATQESGSVNRWKEENSNNFGLGFVEEDDLTAPSWS